jgi:hypothetical protein
VGLTLLLLWLFVELPHSVRQFFAGAFPKFVLGILALALGAGWPLIIASRSHFSRRAEDVLSNDRRAPVLFLRQFDDDGIRDSVHRHQTSEEVAP